MSSPELSWQRKETRVQRCKRTTPEKKHNSSLLRRWLENMQHESLRGFWCTAHDVAVSKHELRWTFNRTTALIPCTVKASLNCFLTLKFQTQCAFNIYHSAMSKNPCSFLCQCGIYLLYVEHSTQCNEAENNDQTIPSAGQEENTLSHNKTNFEEDVHCWQERDNQESQSHR